MSKRYVGRVPPAEPTHAGRGVARVPSAREPDLPAGPGTVRGVAAPIGPAVVRGVAAPTGPAAPVGSAAPVRWPVRHGGPAPVAPAAVDEPVDGATALLQSPDVTAAIFVDGSGRRGRVLRRTAYALVALALLAIVAFWLVQGVDAFGPTS